MKVRFAPNSAGLLHVGDARTALLTFLLARKGAGRFVLRIDDTDPERRRPDFENAIEHDLHWLGVVWDETIRQSERADRYEAAAARLKARGLLYPCFESEEELNAKRDQRLKRGLPTLYDRAMLRLTPEQRAQAEFGGKRPYWRFRLSGRIVEWHDAVLGRRQVKLSAVSDPILIRADGVPHYLFTSAVDDLQDGITDIVEDEDHVTNTGLQLDMIEALAPGRRMPRFAHLPPVLDQAGSAVTRRTARLTLRSLRGDGIEPLALAGYLSRLGTPDEPVIGRPDSLAAGLDLSRQARTSPRFDGQQLVALNRRALRELPFDAVQDRLPPAATPAFWAAIRGSLDLLNEARGWWDVVAGSIVPPLLDEDSDYLRMALATLPPEPWDNDVWRIWIDELKARSGRKGRSLFLPLRQALTGEDHGPELRDLLPLMGRSRTADRLQLAAA